MKYNSEFLTNYCDENKIVLLKNYFKKIQTIKQFFNRTKKKIIAIISNRFILYYAS